MRDEGERGSETAGHAVEDRSEAAAERTRAQLAAVMEIAEVVNSRLDLHEILSVISRELRRVIDYDLGCIAIFEKNENCLYIRHVHRRGGETTGEGRYVPLDEKNLVGWVAINRRPILRSDIPSDTRFTEIMREDGLKSDIVVPLIAKGQLIGTVNVGSYEANHFSDFDLDLLERFSQLTALAIENSLLVEELRALGDKYRKLMSSATDLILIIGYDGTIVECDQAVFRLFGYGPDEIIGKEFFGFTTPARRDHARRTFYRILQGDTMQIGEVPYLRKDGGIVYLDTDATLVNLRDDPCVLVIAHDVTERRILQEKITIQNRELKEKNRKLLELDGLKREFLGRISHELRTPLSIIMAYAGTLLEDGGRAIDADTRRDFLSVIESQSNKLLGLINDLLDLSKVEISDTMLNVTEASVNEMIRIAVKVVEPLALRGNVDLKTRLDPDVPIITFDPLRIRQVCVNLLGNALKFSPAGSSVAISSMQTGNEIIVSIEDAGPGIDPHDLPTIFDDFTQVDGSATRASEGMGIGLRLVKHYIELHRGRVWVKSEPGSGSTFSFSLPRYVGEKALEDVAGD
ncbi:MAG: GAF domain-containing protein [Candidatus Krumholzibacteriota bacterium]|nr:GAF domain-containing protein [Candidatus Krumholzibacteriota bacterium]